MRAFTLMEALMMLNSVRPTIRCIRAVKVLLRRNAFSRRSYIRQDQDKGLSHSRCQNLEKLSRQISDLNKLNLDPGKQVAIERLRVLLKPDSIPVRAKQRRYPQPLREFMTRYVRELLKPGFSKKVSFLEWDSAPLVVSKPPIAVYRLTIDYRPVNAATRPTFRPILNMEVELANTHGSKTFSGSQFFSSYWPAPLHPDRQSLLAFSTPNGLEMLLGTTQGACNSAANF